MAASGILSAGAKVGGKYEVVEIIGYGGMGVVYKVREQVGAVSRIRALKTVLPQFANDADVVSRFRQEAEKMCMLEHENIVPVLSYSEEGEFPYLVMPFIEGQTLKDYLAAHEKEHGGPLPLSEVIEIGLELIRGLEVAHLFVNPETGRPQPMIHRDIKPGNIMCRVEDRGGERRLRLLIMDFGIAKVLSEDDTSASQTNVIGTVKYASPEQIRRGKDIDPRADIYSFGMLLYELYSGHHMFSGLSEHAVLMRMMQRDLEAFEVPFLPGTPEPFRDLIRRAVALRREDRFANVGEMRLVMRQILEEDSGRSATESRQARDRAFAAQARAIEVRAEELAPEPLGEGGALLAKGDEALFERRHRDAVQAFRSAAQSFERAFEHSNRGTERERLVEGLRGLEEARKRASSASAASFASQAVEAAERATAELTRAIESGELTLGARALAQAERAWREAEETAAREKLRRQSDEKRAELGRGLASARAKLEELPPSLRDRAGSTLVAAARRAALESERAARDGDPSAAAAAADSGLDALARAEGERTRVLEGALAEEAAAFRAKAAEIDASADPSLAAEARSAARRVGEAAEQARASGRWLESLLGFERGLALLDKLAREVAEAAAARAAARRDAEASSKDLRLRLVPLRKATLSEVRADHPERRGGEEAWETAERAAAQGDWASALAGYQSAWQLLQNALRSERNLRAHPGAERALQELSRASVELGELGVLTPDEARDLDRVKMQAAQGETRFRAGDFAEAAPVLESAAEAMTGLSARARERIERERRLAKERERQQKEDAAIVERRRAQAALSAARARGPRTVEALSFGAALGRLEDANRLFQQGDFVAARSSFEAVAKDLTALVASVEAAEREERLAALRKRHRVALATLGPAPRSRGLRKRHKAALLALEQCQTALENGDPAGADLRLGEVETIAAALARQGEEPTRALPGRAFPWTRLGAGAGGVAAVAALGLVVSSTLRRPPEVATQPRPAPTAATVRAEKTHARAPAAVAMLPRAPEAAPTAVAPREPSPVAVAPRSAPQGEEEPAPVARAFVEPTVAEVRPTPPPPITLTSA